ncbi:hypothetical protein CLM85_06345 [Streptomyces albidoflavus]|nr:hypothetical protein CLM82_17070 [Streptomyces albidoflavus]PBO17357.1 hypothetical protein CLM83_18540 [Streptomyces albidoflavus]PBO25097.1 hypothetical protein CLM85_06345 [Streptomyces albidoflavus]PBO29781.1 hypothetical protein CLM84_12430 [Streptomyces albidoflavus]
MSKPTRIKLEVDRDGWTSNLQVNLAQVDDNDSGWGYRLAGPKYNGSSRNLLSRTLDERDAQEIRDALNAVFPDERIAQLTDERDRARRWAVGLEQENAELTRQRDRIANDVVAALPSRADVLREAAALVARFTGNDLDANAKMLRRAAEQAAK